MSRTYKPCGTRTTSQQSYSSQRSWVAGPSSLPSTSRSRNGMRLQPTNKHHSLWSEPSPRDYDNSTTSPHLVLEIHLKMPSRRHNASKCRRQRSETISSPSVRCLHPKKKHRRKKGRRERESPEGETSPQTQSVPSDDPTTAIYKSPLVPADSHDSQRATSRSRILKRRSVSFASITAEGQNPRISTSSAPASYRRSITADSCNAVPSPCCPLRARTASSNMVPYPFSSSSSSSHCSDIFRGRTPIFQSRSHSTCIRDTHPRTVLSRSKSTARQESNERPKSCANTRRQSYQGPPSLYEELWRGGPSPTPSQDQNRSDVKEGSVWFPITVPGDLPRGTFPHLVHVLPIDLGSQMIPSPTDYILTHPDRADESSHIASRCTRSFQYISEDFNLIDHHPSSSHSMICGIRARYADYDDLPLAYVEGEVAEEKARRERATNQSPQRPIRAETQIPTPVLDLQDAILRHIQASRIVINGETEGSRE